MIKILIADDEMPERELLVHLIDERFGHEAETRCAENGRIAVTVATLWDADIVLMDIEMPGIDGIDAARQILEQRPLTRIIFVTAYSLFSYAHEAVKLGASDYILKPVDGDDVENAVRRAAMQIETMKQLEAAAADARNLDENAALDKAAQLIFRVKKYIQHNYMSYDISLDSVSDILNMNSSYLSSLFKRCTGINFVDYIADLRIANAKELLRDPLRSATEIADMVGYESSSYFTRAFKKKTGMTPTEYRKSAMSAEEGK